MTPGSSPVERDRWVRVLPWGRGAWWLTAALGVFTVGCVVTVWLGRVTLDEGWYLYCARALTNGRAPYRDFLFTQTPLTLILFAPLAPLGASAYLATRLLCACMGVAAVVLTVRAAWRGGGAAAAGITAAVVCVNAALCFDVCSVKTAAPALLLVAAALDALVPEAHQRRRWAAAALFLSLGVAGRLALAPALALVWVGGVLSQRRSVGHAMRVTAAALVPAGALLGAAWLLGGDRFWFGVVDYHNVAFGASHARPSWAMASFFARGVAANQGLALTLGAVALALWLAAVGRRRKLTPALRLSGLLYAIFLATTLLHVTRTTPYPTHQTMLLPVIVLAGSLTLVELAPRLVRLWPLAVIAAVATVPLQECPLRPGNLKRLEEAAAIVRRTAAGGRMLTFDPALAVAAEVELVPGWELGMFSYMPNFADAARFHARDRVGLLDDLERTRPAVVALQGRDLAWIGRSQGSLPILRALEERYGLVATIPDYGQFVQPLFVLGRIPDHPSSATRVP